MQPPPIRGGSAPTLPSSSTGSGTDLTQTLQPGVTVETRVLALLDAGRFLVSLGGRTAVAASDVPLHEGQQVRLTAVANDATGITLRLADPPASDSASTTTIAQRLNVLGLPASPVATRVLQAFEEAGAPLDPRRLQTALTAASHAASPPELPRAYALLAKTQLPTTAPLVRLALRAAQGGLPNLGAAVSDLAIATQEDAAIGTPLPTGTAPVRSAATPNLPTSTPPPTPNRQMPGAAAITSPATASTTPLTAPMTQAAAAPSAQIQVPAATRALANPAPENEPVSPPQMPKPQAIAQSDTAVIERMIRALPTPASVPSAASSAAATPASAPVLITLAEASTGPLLPQPAMAIVATRTVLAPASSVSAPSASASVTVAAAVTDTTAQAVTEPHVAGAETPRPPASPASVPQQAAGGQIPTTPKLILQSQPAAAPASPAVPANRSPPAPTTAFVPPTPSAPQTATPSAPTQPIPATASVPVSGTVQTPAPGRTTVTVPAPAQPSPVAPTPATVPQIFPGTPDVARQGMQAIMRALSLAGLRSGLPLAATAAPVASAEMQDSATMPAVAGAAATASPAAATTSGTSPVPRPEAAGAPLAEHRSLTQALAQVGSSSALDAPLARTAREHLAEQVFKPQDLADYDRVMPLPIAAAGIPTPARLAVASRRSSGGANAHFLRVDAEMTRLGPVSLRLSGSDGGPLAITLITSRAAGMELADELPDLVADLRRIGVEAAVRIATEATDA